MLRISLGGKILDAFLDSVERTLTLHVNILPPELC